MNDVLGVFRDFLELGLDTEKLKKKVQRLGDTCISKEDFVILRSEKYDRTLIFLTSGQKMVIPESWFSLFGQFNTHSGEVVNHWSKKDVEIETEEDKIGLSIVYLCKLLSGLDIGFCSTIDWINVKSWLVRIQKIGTHELREELRDHGINLDPILVKRSMEEDIEL